MERTTNDQRMTHDLPQSCFISIGDSKAYINFVNGRTQRQKRGYKIFFGRSKTKSDPSILNAQRFQHVLTKHTSLLTESQNNVTDSKMDSFVMESDNRFIENAVATWAFPAFFFLCIWSFWSFWWRPALEAKKPMSSLPMPPNSHWLFGHMSSFQGKCFQESFETVMFDHCDENGRTAFWVGPLKWFSCTQWEDVRHILHNVYERENLPVVSKHVNMFVGPKQMGFLKGKEWRFHRGALVRSLKPESMRQSKDIMSRVVSVIVSSLKTKMQNNDGSVKENVHDLINMITIDSFGKAAFSNDFGCCESLTLSSFSKAFDCLMKEMTMRLDEPVYIPWNYFYWIPTRRNREMLAARTVVRSFLSDMIKQRHEKPTGDILSNLIAAHNESTEQGHGDDCSDETLKDILMSILLAGYDTTSTALAYAFYSISQNPEVEANIVEEIRSSPDGTDVDDYCYCQAVFQETLRLYAPSPQILRTLPKDLKLDSGVVVPAGTFVALPIFLVHRSERSFPSPLEFRPDRWVKRDEATGRWTERQNTDLDTSTIAPGNRDACFEFSVGARSCPGKRFAYQLGTLAMVGLMKDLKFTADPDYKIQSARCGPFQVPKGGVLLTISVRDAP